MRTPQENRQQLAPSDLQFHPRPSDREIYHKPPLLTHNERSLGAAHDNLKGGAIS